MNEEGGMYNYNGILFILKREGSPAICDNLMNLENILSETSQLRNTSTAFSTYMWNLITAIHVNRD
jgi:hypothetical protein